MNTKRNNLPEPMDVDIFYALQEKKSGCMAKDRRREHYIFFSIGGYTEHMQALARVEMTCCCTNKTRMLRWDVLL